MLTMVSWPLNVPARIGRNCTCNVRDCPGFKVAGNFAAESEKPVPLTEAEFTVRAAEPVDEMVTDWASGVLRISLPKPIEVALTLIAAPPVVVDGEREILNVLEIPLSLAVMIAVCAVLTAATFAVKPLLGALVLTMMLLGTVTAGLLLANVM